MSNQNKISLTLRIGLAFAFLYPPIAAFFDPFSWIGYFPVFIKGLVANEMFLLHAFGVIEILLALWILSGKYVFYPSAIATLLLLGIVVFNMPQLDVLFRDLSIAAMAVALAMLHKPNFATKTPAP